MKKCVIYKLTSPSGKVYIGQTVNLYLREIHYRKLHCRKQSAIYNSILKYGFENHKLEVIEECEREQLNEREIYWIAFYDSFNNGLNLTIGGDSGIRSKESNKKISESKMGAKNAMFGKCKELHHRYGKKASAETIKKLRDSHLGNMTGKDNNFFKGYVQAYRDGNLVGQYEGVHDAARKLNLQHPNISKVLLNKRKHTGGFTFKRIAA